MTKTAFKDLLTKAYTFKGKFISLGGAMLDGENMTGVHVNIPLKTMKQARPYCRRHWYTAKRNRFKSSQSICPKEVFLCCSWISREI